MPKQTAIKLFPGRASRVFLTRMVRAPRRTGAIAPSSRFLARAMAAEVEVHRAGHVIELGAGNGVVTKALLAAGIKPERLIVVELDRRLCKELREHFPDVRVVHGDAAKLDELLAEHHVHQVNAIVSSLPLLAFPKPLYAEVVSKMSEALGQEGLLVQFTYSPVSPITGGLMKKTHLTGHKTRRIWLNVPPASVWRFTRA